MKKSLSLVVFLTMSFICSMDQDPKSPRSVPQSPRLAPEPSVDMINKRRSSSSSFHPVARAKKQSTETLPAFVNTVKEFEVRRKSVGSSQPSQHMDPVTAGKVFDDKQGRTTDKK